MKVMTGENGRSMLCKNNIIRLSNFYKKLLNVDNNSSVKNNSNQNICLAFTADNIEKVVSRVLRKKVCRLWVNEVSQQ